MVRDSDDSTDSAWGAGRVKPRYDDQLFARCSKADRRKIERAARLSGVGTSEYIRNIMVLHATSLLVSRSEHGTTESAK